LPMTEGLNTEALWDTQHSLLPSHLQSSSLFSYPLLPSALLSSPLHTLSPLPSSLILSSPLPPDCCAMGLAELQHPVETLSGSHLSSPLLGLAMAWLPSLLLLSILELL